MREKHYQLTHKNNTDVRLLLDKSGIKLEELPIEEDIKKLESGVKLTNKQISTKKLKNKK